MHQPGVAQNMLVVPRALVLGDDPGSLDLACYLLGHAGFEVACARDADQAIVLGAAHRPEVIVLDLGAIRGAAGSEDIVGRLAADGPRPVPVVVMGVLDVEDLPPALRARFADYIAKPIDPATFVDRVSAVLPHA